ncbi:MAG TPA: DUF1501 domain-containing protein [Gemmatimonas aurantiaca]|uniref:DUF1501 domain-containing protein n=2 Tax=Gemmatimonas aurantiaca TaxID=173480 RepID=C1A7C1_GEMAT|nr:DUF1501 domain-containing protein [Gemmatimonas aurantiaca]BAH38131.1 hypothetical protein GAU_1089 [Gemmatimonas aurantiaca T-27]HCT56905.1 DUF1501 domain-containing protein [Gemmatimonas aurantiaca]
MSDDHHHHHGCNEYNSLARRDFLSVAGSVGVTALLPMWLPKVVLAQSANSSRDVIVSIFLSGGTDGMSLVVPFGDPDYYTGRPTIAVPRPDAAGNGAKAVALDNFFGFSPGMAPLMPAYTAGDLLVAHATGSVDNSRSHFDAQRYIEVGKPKDPRVTGGWLGRHLATSTPLRADAPLRALGLTSGLPQTLVGGPKTLPIPNPANFTIGGSGTTTAARTQWLAQNYASTTDPVSDNALDSTNTIALLQRINFSGYAPSNGATYPTSGFGQALRSAAALIKADVGVEAVHAFNGGWDTHATQGPLADLDGGFMHNKMLDLSRALAAFHADVIQGNAASGVTVVIISEFGRNARENGTRGTDHGRGNVAFAMGRKIAGGRVLTNGWPGLARENLESGQDLRVTLDHRDILAEIVQNRLGNTNLSVVFPDFTPRFRGVTKP